MLPLAPPHRSCSPWRGDFVSRRRPTLCAISSIVLPACGTLGRVSLFDWAVFLLWLMFFPIPFFWLVVHPFVDFWRKRRGRTYLAMAVLLWLVMGYSFTATRAFWFGARFQRHAFTYLLGAALVAVELVVTPRAGGALGHAILVGRAEIDPQQYPPRLVDTGIYTRVRHPRYLSAMAVLMGLAMLAGAPRLLALAALSVPLYYLVTLVEERELARRVGEPFRRYQQRVPRFIPRFK